ncbi:MFS transporter [Desulfuribacillus alkaliarsenatis]|uniref:MFS transporter n=2 Tax=Desulfuribacillus alkaliarsenatis TaxID=766136 RepID=A0A1E5G5I3_9FIRM|nr:MFS transporter [Desulfuribacillus alkaliarsenatis]OEF98426.1 MFS transporter [Desulfuribacillus alkaliarsenatis]
MNPQPLNTSHTWSLVGLSLVPFVMVLGNSMLIPILPDMQKELSITQFQVSLIITAFSIPAAIVIPISGYLSDHYGRKKVIIPALLIYALGGLIAGFAASFLGDKAYPLIIAGRIIQGIGAAGTAPIAMALASDIFTDESRSKALGIIEAANGIGKVISPILGSLIAIIVWYATFFAFPILCIPIALIMWLVVAEPKGNINKQTVSDYIKSVIKIFKSKGVGLFAAFLAGSVTLFILFGLLFFLSDILEKRYQIDGVYKGFIIAIPLLVMAITAYITGRIAKSKLSKMKRLILVGMSLIALGSGVSVITTDTYYLMALLVIIGIGSGLVLPCLNTIITGSIQAKERGIVTSLYGSVRFTGVAIGPPVFGYLMKISQQIMYMTMSGLAIFTALIAYFLIQNKKNLSAQKK